MRLPRRVPWATLAELDQVCNWIYEDEADIHAKIRAVNRLSAWRAITPLPHALEAALSLLSSVIVDDSFIAERQRPLHASHGQSSPPTSINNSALPVRQCYATAIVRLVNGLVDPLQLGTYARSIASIAAQIGLPLWLVELRHAATHEDLPSLDVLRKGARESLSWLLHNYFLPALSASNIEQSVPSVQLSPLSPFLRQYKALMKTISRDASLKMQYKDGLAKCLRDIERWLGEAKVASSAVIFNGWGASEIGNGEENERWAIERLCDALINRGGLVPVSSRKRLTSNLKSPPDLPAALIAIWLPLLSALRAKHPSFSSVLVSAITDALLCKPSTTQDNVSFSNKILSYELCLAAWGAWCVEQWESTPSDVQDEGTSTLKRQDVVISLLSALAIRADEPVESRKGANALLGLLLRSHPSLEETSTYLLSATQRNVATASKDPWSDNELRVMEERLNLFLSSTSPVSPAIDEGGSSIQIGIDRPLSADPSITPKPLLDESPRAWTKVPAEVWKPCPIAIYRGQV